MLGQRTEALEERLRSHPDFPAANQNGVALLVIIKTLTCTFEERMKLADSLCDVREQFHTMKQGGHQSLQRHHELFTSHVQVMEEVGATMPDSGPVNEVAADNGRANNPNDVDWEAACQQALAIRFVRGTNDGCKSHCTHLRNSHLDGHDVCPSTLHEACNVLQRRETEASQAPIGGDGVTFVSGGEGGGIEECMAGRNGRALDHIKCFDCQRMGHHANQCPEEQQQEGTTNVLSGVESPSGFSFSQSRSSRIPKEWTLLDNQSTVNLFCNEDLLVNVRSASGRMNVQCNAGARGTDTVGDPPGFGTVGVARMPLRMSCPSSWHATSVGSSVIRNRASLW